MVASRFSNQLIHCFENLSLEVCDSVLSTELLHFDSCMQQRLGKVPQQLLKYGELRNTVIVFLFFESEYKFQVMEFCPARHGLLCFLRFLQQAWSGKQAVAWPVLGWNCRICPGNGDRNRASKPRKALAEKRYVFHLHKTGALQAMVDVLAPSGKWANRACPHPETTFPLEPRGNM